VLNAAAADTGGTIRVEGAMAKARDGNPWNNRVRASMRHYVDFPGVYRRRYPK
jgi:hypothetical protein